ncbi:MAG: GerMN domain-containing protein [Clostridiales bacterium]|nr:GerMN domain-containing protein [Clostridiales bacterium]
MKYWYKLVLVLCVIAITGCSIIGGNDYYDSGDKNADKELPSAKEKVLSIDPEPNPEEQTITLYFKHRYSDYLVPEVRTAVRDKQTWEQLVVEELLKGSEYHDRTAIMPPGVEVLDITRKGETVFVNLSEEFIGDIDLAEVPGKEETTEERSAAVKAEMKLLSIYSIVDSLTELAGVNQVKFLVENRAISYIDLDEHLRALMFPQWTEMGEDERENAVLTALFRDRSYILTPAKSVQTVFEGLLGEPKWDKVYSLLASETASKDRLPTKEELERLWPVLVNGLELDDEFIVDEEIKPDGKAFVTVSYTVNYTSGQKEEMNRDRITVVSEDDIWKVKLPEFITDFR